MELFYPADAARLPVETIKGLNDELFEGWEDGDMPFLDADQLPEHISIITEEEFVRTEMGITMNNLSFAVYWSNWEFFVAALGSIPVGISQKEYIDLMACWYGL